MDIISPRGGRSVKIGGGELRPFLSSAEEKHGWIGCWKNSFSSPDFTSAAKAAADFAVLTARLKSRALSKLDLLSAACGAVPS